MSEQPEEAVPDAPEESDSEPGTPAAPTRKRPKPGEGRVQKDKNQNLSVIIQKI